MRSKGKDKSRVDVYLRPPNGNQLRSKTKLQEYLEKHPEVLLDATVTNFNKHDVPVVNEIIGDTDSDLAEDDDPDPVEDGVQGSPESDLSPLRGRLPGRSVSRSAPNTSSTDAYEESTL